MAARAEGGLFQGGGPPKQQPHLALCTLGSLAFPAASFRFCLIKGTAEENGLLVNAGFEGSSAFPL